MKRQLRFARDREVKPAIPAPPHKLHEPSAGSSSDVRVVTTIYADDLVTESVPIEDHQVQQQLLLQEAMQRVSLEEESKGGKARSIQPGLARGTVGFTLPSLSALPPLPKLSGPPAVPMPAPNRLPEPVYQEPIPKHCN